MGLIDTLEREYYEAKKNRYFTFVNAAEKAKKENRFSKKTYDYCGMGTYIPNCTNIIYFFTEEEKEAIKNADKLLDDTYTKYINFAKANNINLFNRPRLWDYPN